MSIAIYWFKQDLRCEDNPAFSALCQQHAKIIPLYIAEAYPEIQLGGAQRWWLHHSLKALQQELQDMGLDLYLLRGNAKTHLQKLIKTYQVEAVYWNYCFAPDVLKQDEALKKSLSKQGIKVVTTNGSLLHEPWAVQNKSKTHFKVFTPYWRQCLKQLEIPAAQVINKVPALVDCRSDKLENWQLLPEKPNWAREFSTYWQPGSAGAVDKLNHFVDNNLADYKDKRDQPDENITSRLSPHLHFGEISPWQIWRKIEEAKQDNKINVASIERFSTQIGWREFSYHFLYHFPTLPQQNFKADFNDFPWQHDEQALIAWQQGKTGYPIVDAGMRELWRTGFMHNRVRMIVASFLIKDLLIDWRIGADWFNDTLVDADLANNYASWQWVAGSGADAAPYFRIFNPVLQGEKFDAKGEYIHRWVPELAAVANKWIHKPWQAPAAELGIELGKDYPFPLVDHAKARNFALASYQSIKRNNNR